MKITPAVPLADLTEKEWSRTVYELAHQLGWRRYHTYRSERSQPGYPDETLVRERVVFVELKTEKGAVKAAQREWLVALEQAGAEVYVARPRHLDALARVLAARKPVWSQTLGASAEALEARGELLLELDRAVGREEAA